MSEFDFHKVIAQNSGWWWPYESLVILTERPCHLSRDQDGRLHGEDRMAIEYPDGWGIYAWHGVRVPGSIIERPDDITAKEIDGEDNAEIRRVMMDRFGEGRYLEETGAEKVSEDCFGVLYCKRVEWEDEPIVMVRVENSTPETDGSIKPYWLRVPPDIQTPHAAVAWTFGVDSTEYKPAQEA